MHFESWRRSSETVLNIETFNKRSHCPPLALQFQIAVILLLLGWCTYISGCQREWCCHIYIKCDLINSARHNWMLDKSEW